MVGVSLTGDLADWNWSSSFCAFSSEDEEDADQFVWPGLSRRPVHPGVARSSLLVWCGDLVIRSWNWLLDDVRQWCPVVGPSSLVAQGTCPASVWWGSYSFRWTARLLVTPLLLWQWNWPGLNDCILLRVYAREALWSEIQPLAENKAERGSL